MKIRKGFVTNSSSTSFILICNEIFNDEDFFELMGIEKDSDFYDMMYEVFEDMKNRMELDKDIIQNGNWKKDYTSFEEYIRDEFSDDVLGKYTKAKVDGKYIYIGHLRSEDGLLSSFMCCNHFIEENDKIYFNYANCYW